MEMPQAQSARCYPLRCARHAKRLAQKQEYFRVGDGTPYGLAGHSRIFSRAVRTTANCTLDKANCIQIEAKRTSAATNSVAYVVGAALAAMDLESRPECRSHNRCTSASYSRVHLCTIGAQAHPTAINAPSRSRRPLPQSYL